MGWRGNAPRWIADAPRAFVRQLQRFVFSELGSEGSFVRPDRGRSMATPVITIQPPSAEVDVVVRNNTPFSERVWQAILKLLDATQLARLSRVRTSIDRLCIGSDD